MLRVRARSCGDEMGRAPEVATQVSFGVLQIDRSAHRVLVEAEEVLSDGANFDCSIRSAAPWSGPNP